MLDKRSPQVVLEPNENYWNPERKPKARIVFDNIISRAEALELVSDSIGKIDVVTELTPAEATQVATSKNASVVRSDAKTVLVGVFNQSGTRSRWTDVRLRKAVNQAIDRNAVVQGAALGYGTVMPAMLVPGAFGYNEALKPYAYKPAAAKRLLQAAGVRSVTIVAGEGYRPVVEAIAKNLASVGVQVTPVYTGAPLDDNWDLWLVEHFDWSPEYPVGVVYREFFGKDGGFRKMKEDPAFERMYARITGTTDKAQQEALVRQMEQYVYDQANVLFLYAPAKLYAVSKRVNFVPYKTTMLELAETAVAQQVAARP